MKVTMKVKMSLNQMIIKNHNNWKMNNNNKIKISYKVVLIWSKARIKIKEVNKQFNFINYMKIKKIYKVSIKIIYYIVIKK